MCLYDLYAIKALITYFSQALVEGDNKSSECSVKNTPSPSNRETKYLPEVLKQIQIYGQHCMT